MTGRWVRERRGGGGAADADGPAPAAQLVRPIGQGDALSRWTAAARRLELPHGLLVEGARGGGKSTVVRWLTAALLCPSDLVADEPCGSCRTCARVAAGSHPDVHVLQRAQSEAERKEWKTSFYVITVDQVRAAQGVLQRHAIEGRARVAVIADADCLQEEGQNALLKTLEEPGEATFLLLEAARPEQLLPTVRSRVQRLRVLPLADEHVAAELSRRFPGRAERCATAVALARGSLGLATTACTEQAVQLHDLVLPWLEANQGLRPVATARAVLAGVNERRLEVDRARLFLWLLRAELRRRCDALANPADGSYPAASLEPWTSWLERTLHAERDLDLMIPPEQVLAACLVQFVP